MSRGCFFSKVLDATGTLPDAVLREMPSQLRSALTAGREIVSDARSGRRWGRGPDPSFAAERVG